VIGQSENNREAAMGLVMEVLNDIRAKIAADDDVLEEARARRNLVADSAMALTGTLRRFSSGSVTHGTVNDPVQDADGGIVLDRRCYPELGPDGEGEGPAEVVEQLCELVGEKMRETYPDARVATSKRGLKVTFSSPLHGQDPTVDLIATLTRKDADGLWIPKLTTDDWDASHPEMHTELFTSGTGSLRALRARVIRLGKAWNKQWAEPALSSFNITVLAWEYVEDAGIPLDQALAGFFTYARDEIEKANTKDPAGISAPIRLLLSRDTAVRRLSTAAEQLARALKNEHDEELVRNALATVFRDFVEAPAKSRSGFAAVLRKGNQGVSSTKAGLVLGGVNPLKTTRSYGKGPNE
jgi:hypothetical protein